MFQPPFLRLAVLAAALYGLIALIYLVAHAYSFGKRRQFAIASGSPFKGIIYAFGQGMLPWEKESASKHLPTFFAGIFYHLGIFTALLFLAAIVFAYTLPDFAVAFGRVSLVAGLLCGIGLLIKRMSLPYMRIISCPDDYISNILVGLFLLATFSASYLPTIQTIAMIAAVLLFLYIPAGKIRHCFFFFYTRVLFGQFFGGRGVLPHPKVKVQR